MRRSRLPRRLLTVTAAMAVIATGALAPATPAQAGANCTITGTDGNDVLTGTNGDDVTAPSAATTS